MLRRTSSRATDVGLKPAARDRSAFTSAVTLDNVIQGSTPSPCDSKWNLQGRNMNYSFDPDLAGGLAIIPPIDFSDLGATRASAAYMLELIRPTLDRSGVRTRVLDIPGHSEGDPSVSIRLHCPESADSAVPVLVDLHGGGFCVNDAEISDSQSLDIVRNVGCAVLSVSYRLAPENPYPAGLDDAHAAVDWIARSGAEYGIDASRIGLIGQSAGGGIAAGLAMRLRDVGGPRIIFQYLGVPEVDDRLLSPSMQAYHDTPFWSLPNAVLSWRNYLGELHGGDVPIYAAPARADVEQLKGLPPTYISAMQYDPLRDEGLEFGMKLAQAGVPVELHLYPGTFHGSFFIDSAPVSRREIDGRNDAIRRGLGLSPLA